MIHMRTNQKGFGAVEVVVAIVIVGLIATISWLVYDRQRSQTTEKQDTTQQTSRETSGSDEDSSEQKTFAGIKYTQPSGWTTSTGPFNDSRSGNGGYLLSPDYKVATGDRLSIQAGAYISFDKLEWTGIDANTTLEQAVSIVKNGEGGYLDPESTKLTTVGQSQIVTFNSGHTTDGVTVFYKRSTDQWLEIDFGTSTGGDGDYNAQDSPHYATFLSWLEELITLNP